MAGITVLHGKAAVLPLDDVDTDRIIPARFLSMVTKTGYGELLFADVRGPEFPLDQPAAVGAKVLVVGTNFGCGSSREHAVWAIQQGGFEVVIARKTETSPGYSDIFRGNAANCGLALIELNDEDHARLVALGSGAEITLDLPNQTVTAGDYTISFEISEATKKQLLLGLDLVGQTMEHSAAIDAYEAERLAFVPNRG